MTTPKSTNWFICTISEGGIHNWDLCKGVSLWGIPSNGRNLNMTQVEAGDGLLLYWAGKGLIGYALTTGVMKRPQSKDEAPWAGGTFRFGIVVPFELILEVTEPMPLKFVGGTAVGTGLKVTSLRRGFSRIESKDGLFLLKELKASVKKRAAKT